MLTRLLTACFAFGISLAPVVARAADGDTDGGRPAVSVKDSVITTKVEAAGIARDTEGVMQVEDDIKIR